MKIRRLKIYGFKSLRNFELENIPDFAVFVGPNGVGKTTIFQAIGLLKDWVASYSNSRGYNHNLINTACNEAEVIAHFELSTHEREIIFKEGLVGDFDSGYFEAKLMFKPGSQPETTAHPALKFLFSKYDPSSGLGVIEHFAPYRPSNLNNSSRFEVSFDTDNRRNEGVSVFGGKQFSDLPRQLGNIVIDDLIHFKNTGKNRDSLSSIKNLFERLFSPKQLVDYEIDKRLGLQFKIKTPDGSHYLGNLSTGESEVFQIFASFFISPPKSSIIMIDTPEAHLNGAIERKISEELKLLTCGEVNNQVFTATHSYEFINSCPINSLFKIDFYNGSNQVSRVADDRDKLELFENLGASIAVQLSFSKVLFVEDKSTEILIEKMMPNLTGKIKILPSRSATNVEEAAAHSASLLEHTSYSQFFSLRDRDNLTVEQCRKKMGEYPNLIILERHEIENYLLHPEAIANVMKALGNKDLTCPELVEKELEDIANKMRNFAAADYVRYQLDYEKNGIYFKAGGQDPIAVLKSTTSKALTELQQKLNETTINAKLQVREKIIAKGWSSKIWIKEFPGKEILNRFVGKHGKGMQSREFMNLIATEIGRSVSLDNNALHVFLNNYLSNSQGHNIRTSSAPR